MSMLYGIKMIRVLIFIPAVLFLTAAGCNRVDETEDPDAGQNSQDADADTDTDSDADTDTDSDADTDTDSDADTDTDSDADTDTDSDADTDTDSDADTDTDSDADTDTDTDTDADTDSDTDSDTDPCESVPNGCCTKDCHCPGDGSMCAIPAGSELGVCKGFGVPEPGKCWNSNECEYGEYCRGAVICPCGAECDMLDKKGDCMPASLPCCELETDPPCSSNQFCMVIDEGRDTCHAVLSPPYCWTDDDCTNGKCKDAAICACDVWCLSVPGLCL